MTEQYSGSKRLTELVTRTKAKIEACLNSCALLTEGGEFPVAQQTISAAGIHLALLRELEHERRGRDREDVKYAIVYYEAWKKACKGRLDVVKTVARAAYLSDHGLQLLEEARAEAADLAYEFKESTTYADLVIKIDSWLEAAKSDTIEPTAN